MDNPARPRNPTWRRNRLAASIDSLLTALYRGLTPFQTVVMCVLVFLIWVECVAIFMMLVHSALFWEIVFICMV